VLFALSGVHIVNLSFEASGSQDYILEKSTGLEDRTGETST